MKLIRDMILTLVLMAFVFFSSVVLAPILWIFSRKKNIDNKRAEAYEFLYEIRNIKHNEERSAMLAMNTGFSIRMCDQLVKDFDDENERRRSQQNSKKTWEASDRPKNWLGSERETRDAKSEGEEI